MPKPTPLVLAVQADTAQFQRICRTIARHLTALADDLESERSIAIQAVKDAYGQGRDDEANAEPLRYGP